MKTTRIIGIGSPFGDDQAGWRVVEALRGRLPPEVELIKLDRPGTGLVPLLENSVHVMLIDAMQSGAPAGSIRRFDNDEWMAYRHGLSSHGLGVIDALMLARQLGCLPRTLDLYGLEVASASPGDAPSAAIIFGAEALARQLVEAFAAVTSRSDA